MTQVKSTYQTTEQPDLGPCCLSKSYLTFQHSADDKTNFVVIGTLGVNFFAYQCCLLITLTSRQRVSSGKGFRCIGGINLMILTQAILKTMFVCCHTTDSLKIPPTK